MDVYPKSDGATAECTNIGTRFNLTIPGFTPFENAIISFTSRINNPASTTISVNGSTDISLVYDKNVTTTIAPNTLITGNAYYIQRRQGRYCFLGQAQIKAKYSDTNPDSPFSIDRIKICKRVLSGGEFDNIYSDELALQRTKYETWKTTGLETLNSKGGKGSAVKMLQTILNSKGANLVVDSDFGVKTDAVVRKFQKANGLVVDGIVGVKT